MFVEGGVGEKFADIVNRRGALLIGVKVRIRVWPLISRVGIMVTLLNKQ